MHFKLFNILTRWSVIWITSFGLLHAGEKPACDSLWTATARKTLIEIDPSSGSLYCTDTVTLVRTSGAGDNICLRLLPLLMVRGVTIEGNSLRYSRDKERFIIHDAPSDDQIEIVILLEGNFSAGTDFSRINRDAAVLRLDEILASAPHKYGSARFSVSVPPDWESIGPGEFMPVRNDAVNRVEIWHCDSPLPLLGWICAGKFHKMESENNGIHFSTYLASDDSLNSPQLHRLSHNIVRFYSQRFSTYRFRRLSIVEVDNWVAGKTVLAIASPAFIMVKRFAFTTDDQFNRVESILAHEIAHQWWPLTVFMGEDDLPFLSEGLCEHSARWFNRSAGRESGRDSLGNHPLLRPLLMRILNNEETPLLQKKDPRASQTHYLKGAYVHHMLGKLMGEVRSEKLYNLFAGRFAGRESHISDFTALAESLAGRRLDWFFDQWLERTDIPQFRLYNVKTTESGGRWLTAGRVRVVGYQKFSAALKVLAVGSGDNGTDTVFVGTNDAGRYRNDVPFSIATESKPSAVLLDPEDDVLKYRKLPPKLADLREASAGIMITGTAKHGEQLWKYAERDSAEMAMSGWDLKIIADTSATLVDLQKGRIFLYGKPDENKITAEVQEKFPYRFAGGSFLINNEIITDSSLSYIQVIDNPFIQNGLIVWISHPAVKSSARLLPYDASWVVLRGKDEIEKGAWEVNDENLRVVIP